MSKLTRIVAAVVDVRNLTVYQEDGEIIMIPQGDPRLRKIVEQATPQLIKQGWADVEIDKPVDNSYQQFEEKGSGVVKFFRVAKDKLKNLFSQVVEIVEDDIPVPPLSIGAVPVQAAPAALAAVLPASDEAVIAALNAMSFEGDTSDPEEEDEQDAIKPAKPAEPKLEQTMSAIEEIMAHAIPVSHEDFHEKGVAEQGNIVEAAGHTSNQKDDPADDAPNTIIAVVQGENGPKIVPGMERIKTQFGRAHKLGSTAGVEKFLQRIASVIEKRSHSVEDLLKFMERADTPIADDGSIIIYKILKRVGDRTDGKYVDCHTKKVEQWTGAYVCMDEKLVDRNRNEECSNGLHVARRGYLSGFPGDVCVLAKLAPEDVITVPSYDANKMRVCGYHILMELTDAQYQTVKANRPISEVAGGGELLALAIAGKHVRRTHEVRITGQNGEGVVVTMLNGMPETPVAEPVKEEPVVPAEPLSNPGKETLDTPTDPLEVVKTVEKATEQHTLSRKEQAKVLYDAWMTAPDVDKLDRYNALMAFKKAAKKGWDVLGIPDPTKATVKITKTVKVTPSVFPVKGKKTPRVFDVVDSLPQTKEADVIIPPQEFKAPKLKPVKQVHDVDFGDEPADRAGGPSPGVVKAIKARTEASRIVNDVETGLGSYRDRVQKLLAVGLTSVGAAGAIFKLKQQSKKSWDILGVTPEQVTQIMSLKD